ncbi:hypothetical protein CC2G_012064 [Coprinopsis cinerea AmutBmut pab1-1]|nr:hypothetical protein CC2G_012064 [Coprinopsis cinerea AmutBmut pab1-1]
MRTQYSPSDRTLATVAFQATFKVLFWVQLLVWIALCPSSTVAQTSPTHRNVTVPLFSDQIVYTPFLCDAAEMLENPEACAGAWFSTNVPDIPFPVVTSLGQNSSTGDIIPQMFFRFRASTLYLTFVPGFNASVNLTLSATNNAEITTTVQSSIGLATVVNIPEDLITTLALTVLPSSTPVQFGLVSIMMTVPINADPTSIIPSLTLPPPSPISTFFSPTTTSYATSTITMPVDPSRKTFIAHAVGITVGVGLGATLIVGLAFFWWKRRRRKSGTPPASSSNNEGDRQSVWIP